MLTQAIHLCPKANIAMSHTITVNLHIHIQLFGIQSTIETSEAYFEYIKRRYPIMFVREKDERVGKKGHKQYLPVQKIGIMEFH